MNACRHHWLLETPHGSPTIEGRCKSCGEVRNFHAGFQEPDFGHGMKNVVIAPALRVGVFDTRVNARRVSRNTK